MQEALSLSFTWRLRMINLAYVCYKISPSAALSKKKAGLAGLNVASRHGKKTILKTTTTTKIKNSWSEMKQ